MANLLRDIPELDPMLFVLFTPAQQVLVINRRCMQREFDESRERLFVNLALSQRFKARP